MSNLNSRIAKLKTMLGLEEKRAVLQQQLDALQEQLSSLKEELFDESSSAVSKVRAALSPAPRGRKGRSKRGALKEQILAALSSAGQAGVRVTELAAVLGTKAANIHAWFHSTGKKVPGLSKVSGGHYRLKNGASAPAAAEAPAPKAKAKAPTAKAAKPGRRKGGGKGVKRGALSDSIVQALEAAGDKGLKIKDLSDKIGANYRNVSVWFVTTGKNYPKIKKVAPAHYKLA